MNSPIFRKLCRFSTHLRTAILLVALVCHSAFCGEIHDAAKTGDMEKVKAMLKENRDLVNSKDTNGFAPLHLAAIYDRKDLAELLLANRAVCNTKANDGKTPLHAASENGATQVATLLLANGAGVGEQDNNGETPLHLAAANDHADIVKLLLANGAEINAKSKKGNTPLDLATISDWNDVAELLRKGGGQKTQISDAKMIHDASRNGDLEKMKALFQGNQDLINSKDDDGVTPLHLAAQTGRKDIIQFLLANGADVNAKDKKGNTPLLLAAGKGNIDIVKLLIANHADISMPTPYQGESLLGGYGEKQLETDVFKVYFTGNRNISKQQVKDFAMIRAAEVCLNGGYVEFIVLTEDADDLGNFGKHMHLKIKLYKTKPKNGRAYDATTLRQALKEKYHLD